MKKPILILIMALGVAAGLSLLPAAGVADTNIALGKTVTINGSILGGDGSYVTDGTFMPYGTNWNDGGTVYWRGDVNLVIDLAGTYTITGLIAEADDNDAYGLDYWDGSAWVRAWNIPKVSVGVGLRTRPNSGDTSEQYILPSPITTDLLRIQAIDGDNSYSVAEVQAFAAPVPLPPAALLLGSGLAGMLAWMRRRYQG